MDALVEPKKGWRWVRVAWLGLYAVLCGLEFVITICKDFVEERIKGEKPDDDKEKKHGED